MHIYRAYIKEKDMNNTKALKALAELRPQLEEFINKYGTPHSTLIITQSGAELFDGRCSVPFEIRD